MDDLSDVTTVPLLNSNFVVPFRMLYKQVFRRFPYLHQNSIKRNRLYLKFHVEWKGALMGPRKSS